MAWNDERVDLLKKLWSDGLSASQIAGRLGGVTRNAVIGKVHRLGLSGRATTSRMKSHRPRVRTQAATKRLMKPRFATVGNPALRKLYLGDTEPYMPPAEELVIPLQRAQVHPDADGSLLPLADRRSAAGRLPFLRQEQGGRPALLRGACPARLPAAAAAPPRPRAIAPMVDAGPATARRTPTPTPDAPAAPSEKAVGLTRDALSTRALARLRGEGRGRRELRPGLLFCLPRAGIARH